MKNIKPYFPQILFFIILFANIGPFFSIGQEDGKNKKQVLVLEIRDDIDPRMVRYVELAFEEAQKPEIDYVVIDMNTYGGRVDNADEITSRILEFEKPVWVYVNNNAASAGAWISIACDSIYMNQGASIGAATVVMGQGEAAPDKYQSYMRGKMRSTAIAKGRDPKIAEAMVDQNLEIPGVIPAGQVITFSTEEAIEYGYCEGQAESIEDVLRRNGLKNYQIQTFELSTIEKIIRVFLNPYLSGILLLVILGGLYFELQTPGVGFPILAASIAAVLFFVPYYLNGLAENWELLMFAIGVLLIMVEVLVIPGFGLPGIAGLALSIGGLMLMMLGNDSFDFTFVPQIEIYEAIGTLVIGVLGGVAFILYALPRFMTSEHFKNISLQNSQIKEEGYHSSSYTEPLVGVIGLSHTVLRPSGKIEIEGKLYDAYSQGDFIDQGTEVIVLSQEGNSLKVKKHS